MGLETQQKRETVRGRLIADQVFSSPALRWWYERHVLFWLHCLHEFNDVHDFWASSVCLRSLGRLSDEFNIGGHLTGNRFLLEISSPPLNRPVWLTQRQDMDYYVELPPQHRLSEEPADGPGAFGLGNGGDVAVMGDAHMGGGR